MKLKFVGAKPVISEHGISYKDGKHDKYVYIQSSMELLNALNHKYEKGKIYKHDIENPNFTDDEIENIISKENPSIKDEIQNDVNSYEKHLLEEMENVGASHPLLNDLEITALKNNYKIMVDYRIQRAINKIYYLNILEVISKVVRRNKIKDITTPFNEKYWHILHTLQGKLAEGKNPIKSNLIEKENQTLELKIDII